MTSHARILHIGLAVFLAITAVVAAPAAPVGAVPTNRYVETTGSDASNDCSNGGSPCLTIGHAISQSSDGDTIYIGAGTFVENISTNLDLQLTGAGSYYTTLDGGGTARALDLGGSATMIVTGVTITNGIAAGSSGGGISNNGTLTLNQVVVTNNTAGDAGGIYTSGPLTMNDTEVSWNTATGFYGGGVFVSGATTVELNRVTIDHNSTPYGSGAMHVQGGATANLTNVTMADNSSAYSSMIVTAGSTANLVNTTIAHNTQSDGFGAALTVYGTITSKNTIVAGNTPGNCFVGGSSTWITQGNNLESSTDCGFVGAGDQQSTDPQLTQLANYGGSVRTFTLLGTSPAIDSGTNTGCPSTDARGFNRPMDGPGAGGNMCDRGAVEMKPETTVIGPYGLAPSPSVVGQDVMMTVTVSGSSTTPSGTVEVMAGDIPCTITLSAGFGNCGVNFDDPGPLGVLFRYTGDGTHDASQAAVLHIVKQAPRTDFDGDGTSDPAKFEPGTGTLSWRNSSTLLWGSANLGMDVSSYVPRSDFDGDAEADPAKFVSSANAVWFLESSTDTWDGVYMGPGSFMLQSGSDFDGDGKTDPARFDSSTNALWYLKSTTSTWDGVYMGPGTYEVLAGSDYDGDGATDPALFYSVGGANAIWYLPSSTGTWQGVYMGPGTYEMVEASDFDGDGMTDPALFISGANAVWYLQSSNSTWQSAYMGPGTLESVAANDFDGDGKTDPAEFKSATSELWWLKSSTGTWDGLWMGSGTYQVVN